MGYLVGGAGCDCCTVQRQDQADLQAVAQFYRSIAAALPARRDSSSTEHNNENTARKDRQARNQVKCERLEAANQREEAM